MREPGDLVKLSGHPVLRSLRDPQSETTSGCGCNDCLAIMGTVGLKLMEFNRSTQSGWRTLGS